MGEHDREGSEPIRETERTTVVHTDGGRGSSGVVIAIVLLVAVLALLFFLFGGNLNRSTDDGDINIGVDAPEVTLPDINLNVPDKIEIPNVDVDVKGDGDGKAE